ncbi:MAG: S9 family peptidase [Xanthomonadales bacterium]|nr:S9 family peptidase [Xanthomonadales bacterium]
MRFRFLLSLAMVTLLATQNVLADKIPLEDFIKKPQFASLRISPDGKQLAVLAPVRDRMNVVIMNLDDLRAHKPQPKALTGYTDEDVSGFMWANNERILYFMDKDGSESFGIFAVNTDGSMARVLVEPLGMQVKKGKARVRYANVLDRLPEEDDYILVVTNERRASYPDVYKMNIYNSKDKKLVQRNPGNVSGWFTDWDGKVVGASYQDEDELEAGFMLLNEETGELEEVTRVAWDAPTFTPAGLTGDGDTGYVSSTINPDGTERDKAAIFRYNFKTRTFGEMVYEHDVVDCCGLIQNRKKRDMIGVAYTVGIPEQVYFDEHWKEIMNGINQALPNTRNGITSMDENETVGIVAAATSQQPTRYYLYDFEENKLEWLVDSRPWIDAEKMAEIKPIQYKARDGRTIHGYLTLPVGSDGKNLPLVMNPHGGPWARDGWGYNWETQLLANRGYAVLQVNFRGSTGFGRDHLQSSWKQWGRAMQDDITDGVLWAAEQGIVDKDRVCIYGGSYGGYATMAGLTFTPDLYKCGINYVGVTDIALLFETAPDAWGELETMKKMVGDPKTEKEFLEQWSPSNHADKIKVPVFMAYGLQDPRVNIEHAKVMEKGLKKNGVEYELMVKKNEGHGFRKTENQRDFYSRMVSFLSENLGQGE